MRWLALLLVLGCKKTQAPGIDMAKCEQALQTGKIHAALDACPVCGDWKPLIHWSDPRDAGGPTRLQIEQQMETCHAWCNSTAKQRFLGTLDDARGTTSRDPWRYLGDVCKAEVSAVPDSRYMSAPYFALDRIARKLSQPIASFPLPAVSISGSGVELVAPHAEPLPAPPVHVTILGDGPHVGKLPRGSLSATGVTVDYGGEPYPGPRVDPGALTQAIHALDPSPEPKVALFAPSQMPAAEIQQAIAKAEHVEFHRAVLSPDSLPGWPLPAVEAEPIQKK